MTEIVFPELNGISKADPSGRLYIAMMAAASGKLGKAELAGILRSLKE